MMQAEMEIRYAERAQAHAEGVRDGIKRVKFLLERNKVEMPPDVAEKIFGEPLNYDSTNDGTTSFAQKWRGVARGAEETLKDDPRFQALMRKYPK